MDIRITFRIRAVLAILISVSVCFSQTRPPSQRKTPARPRAPFLQEAKSYEENPYTSKAVFKNGLTVLVNEYRAQPVVSIQAYVDTGTLNEPSNGIGLSHLLAAMVRRGTADRTQGTLRQKVQAIGGLFHTEIDLEKSRLQITAPSLQWKRALGIHAEALLNPSSSQDELLLEKKLLLSEAKSRLDDPDAFANEKILELGFDQPRVAAWGSIAAALPESISQESLAAFYKSAYAPENITMVVSGDVSSSEILNEVVRLYGKVSRTGAKKAALPLETTQNSFRYRAIQSDVPFPYAIFGFHTPSENSEDYRALEVLGAILGLGEGSSLTSRLRDQKGLIFGQETEISPGPGGSYLTIKIKVDPEKIDQSELAVLTEIELMKRDISDKTAMERAVAQLELAYWKRIETVEGRAQTLARYEFLRDWRRMDRYVAEIRSVKPADVKRVAERYLRLQNCSLLELLPAGMGERKLTNESARRTFEELLDPAADEERAARAKETVLSLDIPSIPDAFKFSEVRYPMQLASILRGPDMFIQEDHVAPVLDMGFYFPGGKLVESQDNAGITQLLLNAILQGTKEMEGARFKRQMDIYGGRIRPVVTEDYFGFDFSILSKNFEAGFNLLQEAIKTPEFGQEVINRLKQIQSAKIRINRDSISYPVEVMNQALFKDFPYSLDSLGSEKSLAAAAPDTLRNWHETYVKNKKPVVAILGDTKGTSLASYFVKYFSGSRFQETKLTEKFAKPMDKAESVEHSWNKNASLILAGFQAPPQGDEDEFAARVLQSYLGESGRLSQEIRDRMGLASRISVAYAPRLRGGSIIVCAVENNAAEDAALKAIQDEIKKTISTPINYHDLRSARNAAIGIYGIRNQTHRMQIRNIAENVLAGQGLEGYNSFVDNLQAVKEEDFKDAAARIFNLDKAAIVHSHRKSN